MFARPVVSPEIAGILAGLTVAFTVAAVLLLFVLARRTRRRGTCPWYTRGAHMRKRQMDIALWRLLCDAGAARSTPRAKVVEAWQLFLAQPGQDHWACPCGTVGRALFEATVLVPFLEHR